MSFDPDYSSVLLLLPFDEPAPFVDAGPYGLTVSSDARAVVRTDEPGRLWGTASVQLQGGGVWVEDFPGMGSGDFSLEFWFGYGGVLGDYAPLFSLANTAGAEVLSVWVSRTLFQLWVNDSLVASLSLAPEASEFGAVEGLEGKWFAGACHFLLSRVGGVYRLQAPGTVPGPEGDSWVESVPTVFGPGLFELGYSTPYSVSAPLFVDDLRISLMDRYEDGYAPPTGPLPTEGGALELTEGALWSAAATGYPQALGVVQTSLAGLMGAALGTPAATAYTDFTVGLGDLVTRYVLDLTTPTGTVRVPMSSWQATLQTGRSNYVQAVVPAVGEWVGAINTATAFAVVRRAELPDDTAVEVVMATAPVQQAQFSRGPGRYTCVLSGYSPGFTVEVDPPALYDRELAGVRSVSSGSGGLRVRCAIDWLLRPGHRAFFEGQPFVAAYINYYVSMGAGSGDAYMDVGERAVA